ncbi:hypothetical protein CF319_g626 [Tilletia indica]|nr:hypothetical protein CF319_g626 [Tilletia indica]
MIFASARIKDSIISITRSHFFVRLVLPGLTIAFVYAPPRISDAEFLEIFRGLEDCDVVLGDLNVRLNPMLGTPGTASPLGRYHALALWMAVSGFCALPPTSSPLSAASRWDHVLVRNSLWDSLASALTILDSLSLGVDCDHPALHLRFPLEPLLPPGPEASSPDDGLVRMHLSRLHKPGAWQRLQEAYSVLCPDVDGRLASAEEAVRLHHLSSSERQGIIDAIDAVLHEAVLAAGFGALGQYSVKVARTRKDWTRARLEQSTSRLDAERLWRKGLRGKDRPLVSSAVAAEAGLPVKEEATQFWGAAWGASDAPPLCPDDGCLPPGPVRIDSDPLASLFSLSAVERAIKRYPRHKSGGEDGDHGLLLAALSFPQSSSNSPAPPTTALSPALPSVGASRSSARLQGRRSTLNPRAAPFVPLSSSPPPPPPPQLPFPVQLARLFRLCAACKVVPRRWGRALVHLIPKQKTGLPTPQTSRPIAMLPMFRRLFESIFVRQLTADSHWARLHPGQCGFRRGWSCASALLTNHVASSSRPVAIYLDIENAFPSVRAEHELDALRQRGAPLGVRQLSWALLTTGLCARLVVNGFRSEVISITRGLPQGAICSPAFFSLLIDELLHILNDGCPPDDPAAVFYADDGAILARSETEAQELLRRAEAWAASRGLRFNVRKCGVVCRSPISLSLCDQLLPQVEDYRYLGIPRSVDGLDLSQYLNNKLEAMQAVLRRMRAVGGSWTPAARLSVFQSHCASLLDFGGGLLHHFSQLPESPISTEQMDALDSFFDEAVCWISDLPPSRRLLAHSMCGLVSGRVRLAHLALGLEQHLRNSHASNPARALLRRTSAARSTVHAGLITSLCSSPLSVAFALAQRQQRERHPEWDPLSRRSFLRRERRRWLQENTGILGVRVGDMHRLPSLSDRLLRLPSVPLRLLATRWRSGTIFCRMTCVCGERWTRGHVDCLMMTFGFASPTSPPHLGNPGVTSVDTITGPALVALRLWARDQEALANVNLVDIMLGHVRPDWHDFALNTLHYWLHSLSLHNRISPSSPFFSLLSLSSGDDA